MDPSLRKRKPKGDRHHRRRLVLVDPTAVAFEGWQNVETIWTLKICKAYVGWCHIDKLFPYHRHRRHLNHNYANLHYCRDDNFVQRCIEVYRFLYNTRNVVRSEVGLNICQMVYAEVKLNRTVDWRTMKASKKITIPTTEDIPTSGPSRNPRDGLGPKKNIKDIVADVDYQWSESSKSHSSDDDSGPEHVDPVEYLTRNVEAVVAAEEVEVQLPENREQHTKNFYEARLMKLEKKLQEKQQECQVLQALVGEDVRPEKEEDILAFIEEREMKIVEQHRQLQELEEYYIRFKKGENGASSSNANPTQVDLLRRISEECKMQEIQLNEEKMNVEKAQRRLNDLKNYEGNEFVDRALHVDAKYVGVRPELSTMEVVDLKEKLAHLRNLENFYEESISKENAESVENEQG